MFCSRWPKGVIGSFDFKQLEMRLVASESNEKRLLEAFKKDVDVHSMTAKSLFGSSFTKDQRSIAKRINFGVVYGVTAYTLDKEFDLGVDHATKLMEKFFKSYPAIFQWMKKQRNYVNKHGFIKSRFGRVRRLGDTSLLEDWRRAAVERQAGNFPIQSMGADITNKALINVISGMRRQKLRSKVVHQIHDSILIDIHISELQEIKRNIPSIMCSGHDFLKCKLEVDSNFDHHWRK